MKRSPRFDPSKHDVAPNPLSELSSAVLRGWCWMLVREPDGRWTLRQRDWLTGAYSGPVHTSPAFGYADAFQWAEQFVGSDLVNWASNEDKTVWTDAAYKWIRVVATRAARPYAAAS